MTQESKAMFEIHKDIAFVQNLKKFDDRKMASAIEIN